MKKLFLILVSVLLLGGCSVDDDISVSGGSVSSGGDDMAITTYPNVVEASRTVVEGGYLVDYVYFHDAESSFVVGVLSFISRIWDICDKVKGSASNVSEFFSWFRDSVFNVECWFQDNRAIENFDLGRTITDAENSHLTFWFHFPSRSINSGMLKAYLVMSKNGVSSSNSFGDYISSDSEFLRGRFTIFEPSE